MAIPKPDLLQCWQTFQSLKTREASTGLQPQSFQIREVLQALKGGQAGAALQMQVLWTSEPAQVGDSADERSRENQTPF